MPAPGLAPPPEPPAVVRSAGAALAPPSALKSGPRRSRQALLLALFILAAGAFLAPAPAPADEERLETARFTIRYNPRDSDRLYDIAAMLDRAYETVAAELDITPSRPIHVLLYTTEEYRGFGVDSHAFYNPAGESIHILYARTRHRSTADDRMQASFRHEMVHAFMDILAPSARLPRWFKEGMATYLEDADPTVYTAAAQRDTRIGRPPDLNRDPYTAGAAAVAYLMRRHGRGIIRELLDAVGRGRELFVDAFTRLVDEPARFTADFHASLR